MNYNEVLERLDPQVYRSLKHSLQLGKWPDGRALTEQQKEICMEAIIHYERTHNIPEEERVGYIERDSGCGGKDDGSEPVRILN